MSGVWITLAIAALAGAALIVLLGVLWIRRSGMTSAQASTYLRELGTDLVRLPGALRRVAADPRTPRKARWILIGLAIYVVSPIDIIPDFIPVIGHLDEVILVPIVLARVRRMVPDEVWVEHFP